MAANRRSRQSADAKAGQESASLTKFLKGLDKYRQDEYRRTGVYMSNDELGRRIRSAIGGQPKTSDLRAAGMKKAAARKTSGQSSSAGDMAARARGMARKTSGSSAKDMATRASGSSRKAASSSAKDMAARGRGMAKAAAKKTSSKKYGRK